MMQCSKYSIGGKELKDNAISAIIRSTVTVLYHILYL